MKRLISTSNLSKEDWLRYRKSGITGTDAGAILGLNPYRSAFQVYHDKISDTIENIDNEAMRQGRDLEDYVAQRFAAYRHVWEYSDGKGFQQTRVLVYMASGGLFGVGIGAGKLKNVFAATTDLVFGVLCEEWGLLLGIVVLLCFVGVTAYAVQCAPACRSSFYAIAACAAAGMMLFQIALNVFGITDLLPLTGVTLPFISRGGSSMICVWGLFAFIKAADVRTYPKINRALDASFSKQKQGLSATL